MGVVWAATNEAIARDVAIKVMLPEAAEDPAALQRFFNEARLCGSIRHPGIVDVLDLGRTEDGSPFLVMELLQGESLEAIIEREHRLPPSFVVPLVRDVARTLSLAHEKGIVHRDIKPANLFLHRPGGHDPRNPQAAASLVKVLDFGISKVISPGMNAKATQTGVVIGSPAYMSPEHAVGRVAVDERTDIYALGVVLFEALTGRLPFESENYNTLIVDIATQDAPDIAQLLPGIPEALASIVRHAMARDRDQRIQKATELADRLDALVPSLANADREVAATRSPASPTTATSGAGVAGRTGTVVTSTIPRARPPAPPWVSIATGAVLAIVLFGGGGAALLALRHPAATPTSAAPGATASAANATLVTPPAAPSAVVTAVAEPKPADTAEVAKPPAVTPAPSATASAVATAGPHHEKPAGSHPVPGTKRKKDAWGYE